jgi:hypothetical protein
VHTVLVDMRARLRDSQQPNRIFEAALQMAKGAGLLGRKRVLDSTALYDAVATQDTVTMVRAAIRMLLDVADHALGAELRAALKRDDDYASAGKPLCHWHDAAAREALVDALARDGYALLARLDGRVLKEPITQAAALLAAVLGQDLEKRDDGVFRIARRVAVDRVISTVDPEARHGHKTASRGFDGYKGHLAIDPDSEIITATEVTAGNVGDASAAEALLGDVLPPDVHDAQTALEESSMAETPSTESAEVYGDASYGTAALVEKVADFGERCEACPLRARCTLSKQGRGIQLHPKHAVLDAARKRQRDPDWRARYRATRPKVERKIAHLMRRKHGGRRARVRGRLRVGHDFALLAAAINLARLAVLGVRIQAPQTD